MGSLTPHARSLGWEGCHNVRDLGGLETAAGGRTRTGAVVRADNVRGLTPTGWNAALAYGVRRLVDLRFENEVPGEPDADPGVEVVSVPLHGSDDREFSDAFVERVRVADDVAPVFAFGYVHTLAERPRIVARAVAAVAAAGAGARDCVVVHCFAGKDRTGVVCGVVLAAVGVADDEIVADYAASNPGVERLSERWFASAPDEAELALRHRFCLSPPGAMGGMLAWLREQGGAEAYLLDAGLSAAQVSALQQRLVV